jgi:hypothetical protein
MPDPSSSGDVALAAFAATPAEPISVADSPSSDPMTGPAFLCPAASDCEVPPHPTVPANSEDTTSVPKTFDQACMWAAQRQTLGHLAAQSTLALARDAMSQVAPQATY